MIKGVTSEISELQIMVPAFVRAEKNQTAIKGDFTHETLAFHKITGSK